MSTPEQNTGLSSRTRKVVTKTPVAKKKTRQTVAKKITPAAQKPLSKTVAARKAPKKVTSKKTVKTEPILTTPKTQKVKAPAASLKPVVSSQQSLAILSPWRLPLDIDKVASQTARFAGVFFIILGAIFTLWHANAFLNGPVSNSFTQKLLANVSGTNATIQTTTVAVPVADSTWSFDFNQADRLSGTAVMVRLPVERSPKQIVLRAQNSETGSVVELGRMNLNGGNIWQATFDSTKLPNGRYFFTAVAEYQEGGNVPYSVTISDAKERQIENTAAASAYAPSASSQETSILQTQAEQPSTSRTDTVTDTTVSSSTAPEAVRNTLVDNLNPHIAITLPNQTDVTDVVPVTVTISDASLVELYAIPASSATQKYIGQPKQISADSWQLLWDTRDVPNGTYRLLAKVRTDYGFFTATSDEVSLRNVFTATSNEEYITRATAVANEMRPPSANSRLMVTETSPQQQLDALIAAEMGQPVDAEQQLRERIAHRQTDLDRAFQVLATAYRSADAATLETARAAVDELAAEIRQTDLTETSNNTNLPQELDRYLEDTMRRIQQDVEKMDSIIAERTSVAANTDTDRDGIPDFDEVSLYQTNPRVADTDGDGFPDGVEILRGYNPLDSTPEVAIRYESPQEVGVIRTDILAVHSITAEKVSEDSTVKPAAVITGKGLPNSYATLYIFSTPVIVTVRTDHDGAWMYRFDKELEDGTHQIYVGLTDNAGRIVAKSNPLLFTKEAQAYSVLDQPTPGVLAHDAVDESNTYALLLVASISIVAIGLVLLVLGFHMQQRPRVILNDEVV